MPMLRHVNKDHIVPELQLVERFHRLMIAAEAEAMDGQRCLATRSSMGNGLCGLATCHPLKVAVGWAIRNPAPISHTSRDGPSGLPGPLVAYALATFPPAPNPSQAPGFIVQNNNFRRRAPRTSSKCRGWTVKLPRRDPWRRACSGVISSD